MLTTWAWIEGTVSTSGTTAANFASFYLRPYNFFDEDPSMASCDTVLISPAKNGKFDINRFGTPEGPARAAKDRSLEHKGVP